MAAMWMAWLSLRLPRGFSRCFAFVRVPRTRRSRSEGTWPVPSLAVSSIVSHLFRLLIARVGLLVVSGDKRDAEILALRHQILVLQRQIDRPSFTPTDRTILALLSRCGGRIFGRVG